MVFVNVVLAEKMAQLNFWRREITTR